MPVTQIDDRSIGVALDETIPEDLYRAVAAVIAAGLSLFPGLAARSTWGGWTGLIGLILLTMVTVRAFRGHYSPEEHRGVEVPGIYWHFVDVMWIIVFASVYLL